MRRMIARESRRGQSLLEMGLILPLVFLLIVNTVNFGAFFYDWITVANAGRTGAQLMIMGPESLLGGSAAAGATAVPPSAAQIVNLIANDVKSLPNASSNVVIKLCTNTTGTMGQISGTTTSCTCENISGGAVTCGASFSGSNTDGFCDSHVPPTACSTSDAEYGLYVLATVDVSYTYNPLIKMMNFPQLHIFTTLPPTTIHRTAVMRMLQ